MFGGLGGIGALGSGFMQGLDQAAQLRDRQTELKIKALKLQNDWIDAQSEAAAFKAFASQGMLPPPKQDAQGQQGQGQQQAPQVPAQPQMPGVSGLPGAGAMPSPQSPTGGAPAMAPGQPSMPSPQAGAGAQPQPQQPYANGTPNPYAAPIPQIDPQQEIQQYVQRIKQANPGVDDRTLYHATLKAMAFAREVSPETRIMAQAQLEALRAQERYYETNTRAATAERGQDVSAANTAARVGAQERGQDVGAASRLSVANTAAASRERVEAGREATVQRGQDITSADRKAARDASMARAQMIQQQITARFAQGQGDKTRLQAQVVRSREIVAQMNAAQRIMNGIELAKPGVKPETDAQYAAALKSYEDANQKLEILAKQAQPEGQGATGLPSDLPSPEGHAEGSVLKNDSGKTVAVLRNGQWAPP